jgi:hypothetical protein
MVAGRPLQHSPKVDLGEAPIVHPLDQVGTELQFPVPPLRPCSLVQPRSPSLMRCPLLLGSVALLANGAGERRRHAVRSTRWFGAPGGPSFVAVAPASRAT